MKLDRRELLRQLESTQAGLSSKENLDQSDCFAFIPGQIITFNDEICCRQSTELDFRGAVSSGKLLQLLRNMSEDEVDVSVRNDAELSIKGVGRRAGIKLQQDILLPHHVVDVPTSWTDCVPAVGDYIGLVAETAGKDHPQFILNCVRLTPDLMEATNEYQAMACHVTTGLTSETLVRRQGAKALDGMGVAAIAESDSWVHFKTYQGLVMSLRRQEPDQAYPDLTAIYEAESDYKVEFPGSLIECLDKATAFASKTASGKQIGIKLKDNKMLLRASDGESWYEEMRDVHYSGNPVGFGIGLDHLRRILEQGLPCYITPTTLRVKGEGYVLVCATENIV